MSHQYMSEQEIREAEQRCQQATPGEWKHVHFDSEIGDTGDYEHFDRLEVSTGIATKFIAEDWGGQKESCENFDFMADSHQVLPRALADLRELRRVVRELVKVLRHHTISEYATPRQIEWWERSMHEEDCLGKDDESMCSCDQKAVVEQFNAALALAQQVEGGK